MCNTLLLTRLQHLQNGMELARIMGKSQQVCIVHEPKTHRVLASDPIFGCFATLRVWVDSLNLTYPDKKDKPYLENVIYEESDGFCWFWSKLNVWNEPEAF